MEASEPTREVLPHEIAWEAFGVRVGVGTDAPELAARIPTLEPPHSRSCEPAATDHHFSITGDDEGRFSVRYDVRDGVPARIVDAASYVVTDVDLELAFGLLDTHLHGAVAYRAPEHIFIHGSAVAHQGRVVILPAMPLTGRTTLVTALARAGATPYSDQFAVVDEDGLVHPYARDPDRFDGAAGETPLPLGAVVATTYRPGAEWRPTRLSRGAGIVMLLSHTVPAQDRPDQSMRVLTSALEHEPPMVMSDRDEADAAAPRVLAELERALSA